MYYPFLVKNVKLYIGSVIDLKKLIMMFMVVFLVSFSNTLLYAEENNLIKNPGFEDSSSNNSLYWVTNVWTKGDEYSVFSVDQSVFRSGTKSVCIQNLKENHARFKQMVRAKPNTYYKMTCFAKAENVGMDKLGFTVEECSSASRDLKGTSAGWEYLELYGKTGPEQKMFEVTLALGGYGNLTTGKAWFDDYSIEELDSLPAGVSCVSLVPANAKDKENITKEERANTKIVIIIIGILFLAIIALFIYLFYYKKSKSKTLDDTKNIKVDGEIEEKHEMPGLIEKIKLKKIDKILTISMTIIYPVIALNWRFFCSPNIMDPSRQRNFYY